MTLVVLVSAVALLTGTLHGTVMRGPIAPVCRVGTPCSGPAKNVALSFTRKSATHTTTTDDPGRYSVRLPAGVYAVKTNQRPSGLFPQPRTARVRAGRSTPVDFAVDTEIR